MHCCYFVLLHNNCLAEGEWMAITLGSVSGKIRENVSMAICHRNVGGEKILPQYELAGILNISDMAALGGCRVRLFSADPANGLKINFQLQRMTWAAAVFAVGMILTMN